jgi:hypothetical protein
MKKFLALFLIVAIFASSSSAETLTLRETFLVSFGVLVSAMFVGMTVFAFDQLERKKYERRRAIAQRAQLVARDHQLADATVAATHWYDQLRLARAQVGAVLLERFNARYGRQTQRGDVVDIPPVTIPTTNLFDDLRETGAGMQTATTLGGHNPNNQI